MSRLDTRGHPDTLAAETAKILAISRVAHEGGAERILLNAAEAARCDGLRPLLAIPGKGALAAAAAERGLPVRHIPISRGRATVTPWGIAGTMQAMRRGGRELLAMARQERVALLHAHHPVTGVQALPATKHLGLPLLLHVHETLPAPLLYRLLARRLRRHAAAWVCVSEASRAMVRSFGVEENRISLLYNAVQSRFLADPVPALELRGAGPHVGLFGVLEPRKGHADFLRALALLRDEPMVQAWIVGDAGFGEHRRYADGLMRLAGELGLTPRVHLTGRREDVPAMMAGMDAVVLASTGFESLPTALIEACVIGRPVVATDVGGVREIVTAGVTGLVVPPGNPAALATALHCALSPLGRELAAAARVEARRRFAPDRFASEMAACYRALLASAIAA